MCCQNGRYHTSTNSSSDSVCNFARNSQRRDGKAFNHSMCILNRQASVMGQVRFNCLNTYNLCESNVFLYAFDICYVATYDLPHKCSTNLSIMIIFFNVDKIGIKKQGKRQG